MNVTGVLRSRGGISEIDAIARTEALSSPRTRRYFTAATGEPVPLPSDRPRNQRIALAAAVIAQNPTATFSETHYEPSP